MREPHRRIRPRPLRRRIEQAGMFVAAANAPLTFQRTLMPRTTLDQGVVTGLAAAAHYGIAAVVQDAIEEAAGRTVARRGGGPRDRRRAVLAADKGAFDGLAAAGPSELGVDRTLWAGTPQFGRWKDEVLTPQGAPRDPSVGGSDRFEQLEALDPAARARPRTVFVTHDEDPVAKFGPSLLVRAPGWLGPPASRPPGVPRSETWQTPTTFLQTLVDMKNSVDLAPVHIEARGHDYRGDVARFVRKVFALPATDDQLESVEAALRRFETARAVRIRGS